MGTKRNHDISMEDPAFNCGAATVLCCSCGVSMVPNQTMRCVNCLKSEVSIIDGISRQVVLHQCRTCKRYNRPPWTHCEPESRMMLGMCLKKIRGLGKDVRLVDAAFIWTEEHSRRIRVKITVQKEVAHSSVLKQTMVVEFTVVNQQCEDCQKSFTPHSWNAIVQVRQKVAHRRTFCFLEQLILKNDAHDKVLSLTETREGLDFHFAQRSHAQRFADFVMSCVPAKAKNSKHLVSHDANSNAYNYKYTILLDLCPICADDVVHVPRGYSSMLSGAAEIMLCHKVSNGIRLIDPLTLRCYDIPTAEYWKRPLGSAVCTRSHLTEFVVLNIEEVERPEAGSAPKHHLPNKKRMGLVDVEVARTADLGVNDDRLIVRSHLGSLLRIGTKVLGYDMRTVNVTGDVSGSVQDHSADIILVRKQYKRDKTKKRGWELRRMDRNNGEGAEVIDDAADMEAVCQDLEEDPELRKGVNLYRTEEPVKKSGNMDTNASDVPVPRDDEDAEEDDEDAPEVPLAELLEGLHIKEEED